MESKALEKNIQPKEVARALYIVYRYTSYRKETDFETIKAFRDYYDARDFATKKCIEDCSDASPDSGYLYRDDEITYSECVLHFQDEHKPLIRLCHSTGYLADVWCVYKLEVGDIGLEKEITIALRMEAVLESVCDQSQIVPYIAYDKAFDHADKAKKFCFDKARRESLDGKVHSGFPEVEDNWKTEGHCYHFTGIGPNVQVGTQSKNVWAYHTVPIVPKSKEEKYVILIETRWDKITDEYGEEQKIPKQFFSFLQHSGNEEVIAQLSNLLRPEIEYEDRIDQKYDFSLEDNYRVDHSTASQISSKAPQRCRLFQGKMKPVLDSHLDIALHFPPQKKHISRSLGELGGSIDIQPGDPEEWTFHLGEDLSLLSYTQFSGHLIRGYDEHPYYEFA